MAEKLPAGVTLAMIEARKEVVKKIDSTITLNFPDLLSHVSAKAGAGAEVKDVQAVTLVNLSPSAGVVPTGATDESGQREEKVNSELPGQTDMARGGRVEIHCLARRPKR